MRAQEAWRGGEGGEGSAEEGARKGVCLRNPWMGSSPF